MPPRTPLGFTWTPRSPSTKHTLQTQLRIYKPAWVTHRTSGNSACWFLMKDAAEVPDERTSGAGAWGKGRGSHAPPDCTTLQNPPCTLSSGSCQNLASCVFIETSLHKRDRSCNPSTGLHAGRSGIWISLATQSRQSNMHTFLYIPAQTCAHTWIQNPQIYILSQVSCGYLCLSRHLFIMSIWQIYAEVYVLAQSCLWQFSFCL